MAAMTNTPRSDDPAIVAQRVFRGALDAIAHPGRVVELPAVHAGIGAAAPAALALLMALADSDTPVWLEPAARDGALADHLRFHCGCPIVDAPAAAAFALVADPTGCPPLDAFAAGTPEYPDRSTTLVLQLSVLAADAGVRLTGPGIETAARLDAAPLPAGFWRAVAENNARFPLGIDIFLAADCRIAALPRSVTLEA